MGWVYTGHGEWTQTDSDGSSQDHGNPLLQEPEWIHQWLVKNDEDIALQAAVKKGGYPNRWGARIPVKSRWNLDKFRELLKDYDDTEVIEWIQYGWPTGRLPTLPQPTWNCKNHKRGRGLPSTVGKVHYQRKSVWGHHGSIHQNTISRQHRYLTS